MEALKRLENHSDAESDVGDTGSTISESPPVSYEVPTMLSSWDGVDENYQKVAEAIIHHSKDSGKKISAPYEVPHFPIERDESRRALQRQLSSRAQKELEQKRNYDSNSSPNDVVDHRTPLYDKVFVPHFQRVSVGGEHCSGVPLEDLQQASALLLQALKLRQKYMKFANQTFPPITSRFLKPRDEHWLSSDVDALLEELEGLKKGQWVISTQEPPVTEPPTIAEPWNVEFIEGWDCVFSMDKGVYQVFRGRESPSKLDYRYPPLSEFVKDMQLMCAMIADGPL